MICEQTTSVRPTNRPTITNRAGRRLVPFLCADNITLVDLASLTRFGLIDGGKARGVATDWTSLLKVRTPSINTLCLGLSGGNQQKVVLAKWPNAKARILVLDHPSSGLGVGAEEEVYELVRRLTGEGLSIVLTSDTLEETIGLSHTVLVTRDGEITHRAEAARGAKPRQVEISTLGGQPSDAETLRAKFAQLYINESTGAKPFGAGPNARG